MWFRRVSAARPTIEPATLTFGWAVAYVALIVAASLLAPTLMLLAAPLLLGVPHVAADVRFLVLRPRLPLAAAAAIFGPLLSMTVLRVLDLAGGSAVRSRLDVTLGVLAILGGVAIAPTRPKPLLVAWLAGGAAVALTWPSQALVALVHGHNAVAVALVVAWSGFGAGRALAFAGLVVGVVALLGSGSLEPLSIAPTLGLRLDDVAESLAPGLSLDAARRVALVFAFGQALHFAAWLHLIPRSRTGGSLRDDFGKEALIPLVALCVLVPMAALLDPVGVRKAYLSLVSFHAWLELAALAYLQCTPRSSG